MKKNSLAPLLLAAAVAALCVSSAKAAGVVNIYSYRQPELIQPLLDLFTKKTGIATRMIYADKGLVERLGQEGPLSPADLLLTADVGRLADATSKGLGQPVIDASITSKIPPNLRSPDNQWFGLTLRGRVVYASQTRVAQNAISYEDLADPKWKGKICTRPGDHPYNLGLIASMIGARGRDATKAWLTGLKANLAIKPSGTDRSQAQSIFAGECDLALGNTYYVGLMATNDKEPEQKDWAKAIKIIFPNSPQMSTNVNISGMLLTKAAPDKDNAIQLMEFLASDEAQVAYAALNFEYPANPAVPPAPIVASWGTLPRDHINLGDIAKYQKDAADLVDETGFNN